MTAGLFIQIPPLREQFVDVPLLLQIFLKEFCENTQKATLRLSLTVEDRLQSDDWSGNIREFKHCIERTVILCNRSEILPPQLDLMSGHLSAPSVSIHADGAERAAEFLFGDIVHNDGVADTVR